MHWSHCKLLSLDRVCKRQSTSSSTTSALHHILAVTKGVLVFLCNGIGCRSQASEPSCQLDVEGGHMPPYWMMTNLQKLIAWQAIAWKDEHIQRHKRASSSDRLSLCYSSNTQLTFEEAHHPHIAQPKCKHPGYQVSDLTEVRVPPLLSPFQARKSSDCSFCGLTSPTVTIRAALRLAFDCTTMSSSACCKRKFRTWQTNVYLQHYMWPIGVKHAAFLCI